MKARVSWFNDGLYAVPQSVEDTWGCYVEFIDSEEDPSMEYMSIELKEDGQYHGEVGTCGMYGGAVATEVFSDLFAAMSGTEELFKKNLYGEITEIESVVLTEA